MSDQQIGLQARLMSKAMRKIVGSLALSQCSIFFLNQLRSKVGVIYGSPEVTAGGNALKFYASVRIDTRRRDILPDNIGIRIRAKVVKNKVAPPFNEAMLDILFGSGIDRFGCLVDAAVECDVVVRKGSWYSYADTNFAQGRFNAAEVLREDAELAKRIDNDVRAAMSLAAVEGVVDEKDYGDEVTSAEAEETAGAGVVEVVGAVEQLEPPQHGAVAAERCRLAARELPGSQHFGNEQVWCRHPAMQDNGSDRPGTRISCTFH